MIEHYAEDYSLFMGIVDLIPVILFALAGCILIKHLFNALKKPYAVFLSAGISFGITAGTFKALWKILISLNVCDFYPFDAMFMPIQSLALVLMGVGLISILFDKEIRDVPKANMVIWPLLVIILASTPARLENGSIMFIAFLVIGEAMIATSLSFLAVKNKNWICLALFILSFIGLMVMGAMKPLSTKMNLTVTQANWIEQSVNIVAQLALLAGCYLLSKQGFFAYKENK